MQVKIWNDHHKEYSEKFRGRMLVIPPHGFIEMGRAEGNRFLHQMTSFGIDGTGKETKVKMLRMEKPAEEFANQTGQPIKYTARDGKKFRTEIGLKEHEATLPENTKDESGPRKRREVKAL